MNCRDHRVQSWSSLISLSAMIVVAGLVLALGAACGGGGGNDGGGDSESDAAAAAAKQLFADKGCTECHGTEGEGDGTSPKTVLKDTRMIIQQFTQRTRNGKGSSMPAYGPDKITDDEIKQLHEWLKVKK